MNRFRASLGLVLTALFTACDKSSATRFDPELPEPSGRIIALRGEENAPVIPLDDRVLLTFDSDKRFFHGAADAIRLKDNSLAIANEFTNEIFLFDSTGKFKRAIGRPGSGPGEFHGVNSLSSLGGDTIVAFDRQVRKVVLFTAEGEFVDEYRVNGPPEASPIGHAGLVGTLGQNRVLIWSQAMPTDEELNLPPNKPAAMPEVPFSIDVRGNSPVAYGRLPGSDLWVTDASGMEANYGPAPFGRRTWFGALHDKTVVMRNTEPAFRVFLEDGSPHAVYHGSWRARKVTQRDREQFMENWFTNLRKESYWKQLETLTEQAFPETTPYFRDAIIGSDAVVWIEPYESCCGDERIYFGYDLTGVAVGKLVLPNSDRVLEIGDGVLLAARTEELGTATVYVQRYRTR